MKRVMLLVLIVVLSTSLLTACSSGNTANKDVSVDKSAAAPGEVNGGASETSGPKPEGIYQEAGNELEDYYDALINPEDSFDEIISNTEGISENMEALSEDIYRLIPLGALVNIIEYDDLLDGKLPLSGYEATKETNGDEIKFSANYVYPENQGAFEPGDKITVKGLLNTATNTLTYEQKTERSGKAFDRTVIETIILPDGTRIFQYLTVSKMSSLRETDKATKLAVFKRYNETEYSAITATFDEDYDFVYDSIVGKSDITTAEMASKYITTGKFSVANGKATFEKQK